MNASTTKFDLQLAGETQLPALLPLIADYHAFESVSSTADEPEATARTLLAHPEFGTVWLVRPDGLDAGYIAPGFRGHSIGTRVLVLVRAEARARDIIALHLEVARDSTPTRKLYSKAGFEPRD